MRTYNGYLKLRILKKAFDDGLVQPKSAETIKKLSDRAKKSNEKRKKRIEVIDKRTGDVLVFKSSIEASAHFNRSKGYFREVVTKKGGENLYFKVRDI